MVDHPQTETQIVAPPLPPDLNFLGLLSENPVLSNPNIKM